MPVPNILVHSHCFKELTACLVRPYLMCVHVQLAVWTAISQRWWLIELQCAVLCCTTGPCQDTHWCVHCEPPKVCCAMPRLTAVSLYTAKCIYKHKPDGRHLHTHSGERSVHYQQVLSPGASGQSMCMFWAVDMCMCTHAHTHTGCKRNHCRISIGHGILRGV